MAVRHVLVAVVGVAGLLATPGAVNARPAHSPPSGGTADSATPAAIESVTRHLPPGFRDRVVYRAHEPTALAWTPDGRMLVTRKTGRLFVVRRDGSATQALNLRRAACINGSRGLISVAVDPRFRRNRFVYLYWTHDAHNDCFSGSRRSAPQHRVTRYVLTTTTRSPDVRRR
ncbi:MAG: PQQ-dependent sugar dehydrogenase [Nocardioidaceae bacterium]